MSKGSWAETEGGKTKGRPSSNEYFMKMAHLVKERSTCPRRMVGAVIVKDKHILTTGYNGNPKGMKHCDEIGCLRDDLKVPSGERHELCTGLHAEQNAIIQSAVFGVSIKGATMYCTNTPCSVCAKMIVNAGIKKLIYENGYPDLMAEKIMKDCGVELQKVEK
ncbi:MAG: cytidine/deoxycytidylate deaminase family protein [archaeon]